MARDILIVDDEADIRMLINGVLHDEGYATREAADSDSALEAIAMVSETSGIGMARHCIACRDLLEWRRQTLST